MSSVSLEGLKVVAGAIFLAIAFPVAIRNVIQLWRNEGDWTGWPEAFLRAGPAVVMIGSVFFFSGGIAEAVEAIDAPFEAFFEFVVLVSMVAFGLFVPAVLFFRRPRWAIPPHLRSTDRPSHGASSRRAHD